MQRSRTFSLAQQIRHMSVVGFAVGCVVGLALYGSDTHAHARLVEPAPRSGNSGIKIGPCGTDGAKTPLRLQAGSEIDVFWEETIHHPGHYRLAWGDANAAGFDENVAIDDIPDNAGTGCYRQRIQVPTTSCEHCTLQMIQVMTERVSSDGTFPEYFSCADVEIVDTEDLSQVDLQPASGDAVNGPTSCFDGDIQHPAVSLGCQQSDVSVGILGVLTSILTGIFSIRTRQKRAQRRVS